MKDHCIPTRLAKIKTCDTIKHWGRCGTRTFIYAYWESKLLQALWKIKIRKPYNPATPNLGIHAKETCAHMTNAVCMIAHDHRIMHNNTNL